jgi:integrase
VPISVTQRADGRWCASIQVNASRRYVYGRTERETRDELKALEKQVAVNGTLPDAGRRTLNDLLDAWLSTAELKPKTRVGYDQTLAFIRPALGRVKLVKLEPIQLQRLYSDLAKHGQRTPYRAHLLLHHVFGLAVVWGWLPTNGTVLISGEMTRQQSVG